MNQLPFHLIDGNVITSLQSLTSIGWQLLSEAGEKESGEGLNILEGLINLVTRLIGFFTDFDPFISGTFTMQDVVEVALYLIIACMALFVGYWVGSILENLHYRSIRRRENELGHLPAIPTGYDTLVSNRTTPPEILETRFVTGTVVLAEDYFKRFVGLLRKYFGGNMPTYETLLDRARREAILRMKEKMPEADIIVNLRLESTSVCKEGGENGTEGKSVEIFAYGTAIKFKPAEEVPETAQPC